MASSSEVDASALRDFAAALDAEAVPAGADVAEYVSEHLSMPSVATAALYNQTARRSREERSGLSPEQLAHLRESVRRGANEGTTTDG